MKVVLYVLLNAFNLLLRDLPYIKRVYELKIAGKVETLKLLIQQPNPKKI